MPTPPPKLLDDAREVLRARHDAYGTELHRLDAPLYPVPPAAPSHAMGCPEIEALLIHRATEQPVAVSTQNQARSAILFRYRYVLELLAEVLVSVLTARTPRRLSAVFTRVEVRAVLARLYGFRTCA